MLSMGLVLTCGNGLHFLFAWEAFALSAYFLITLEHDRREVRKTGWLYLVASHAHPIFERVFKRYDRLNNVVQENLRVLEAAAGTMVVLASIAAITTEGTIWVAAAVLGVRALQGRRRWLGALRRRFS